MNISSWQFLRNLRTQKKQFAVIGLGRFGRAVCETLHGMGYEVLGVDRGEKAVSHVLNSHIVSHALELDSTDPNALEEGGLFEFDTVIVAIGNYIEASVITTLNLKDAGVNSVLAKASSDIHGKLLNKVGADIVIFPEYEMGCEVARSLTQPNVLERLELDPHSSIVEVIVPEEFHGKTLMELNLRSEYGVNVLALGSCSGASCPSEPLKIEQLDVNPHPEERLEYGMVMVVIGRNDAIKKLTH
ncbi:MAG: TrkA family potassium uptake protein [Cyanobacteria bacterium P01_D01_bin.73]